VVGAVRVARPGHLPGRWRTGDVVALDLPHVDDATARALLEQPPAAVLLAGPATSQRYPHRGPELLLAAGVVVVDGLGPRLLDTVRDGTTVRIEEGRVLVGAGRDRWADPVVPLQGRVQDLDAVAAAVEASARGMSAQLEAFAAGTTTVLAAERDLLLEGVGVPQVPVALAGRPVVVCVPGYGHTEDLHRLRRFVADARPVLVGVGRGADALVEAGLRPDLVVTDPGSLDPPGVVALSRAAHVVVHTRPGDATGAREEPGTTRFPSRLTTEDTAILLAHGNGASCIVTVGSHATLEEFLDRGRVGSASSFLTRLRAGSTVVDAAAVVALHRPHRSWGLLALLLVLGLVAVLAVVAATPWGQEQLAVVADAARSWPWPTAGGPGG